MAAHIHKNMVRRLAFAIVFVAGTALVATSILPRLQNGIYTIPSPGSGYPMSYVGVREFGWPATLKTERFTATHPPGGSYGATYSPIEHVIGRYDISVFEIKRSMMTGITINLMFFAAAIIFTTLALNALFKRRFTLRELLGVVTCLGIMMGLLAHTWSRPGTSLYFRATQGDATTAPTSESGRVSVLPCSTSRCRSTTTGS